LKILPEVSIFTPVYNDQHTIRELAISAHKKESRRSSKFEIIIADDGSPDNAGVKSD